MLIWKQELPHDTLDNVSCELPFNSVNDLKEHVMKIDLQHGHPVIWFQADDDTTGKIKTKKEFILRCIGTGHSYSDPTSRKFYNQKSYLGSAILLGGDLVLHYFALSKTDINNERKKLKSEITDG